MKEKDTIVSIATPMGTGALSIIRCSGDEVSKIIDIFLKKKLSPRHAHYINFKNKDNIVVDDIIAISDIIHSGRFSETSITRSKSFNFC